MSVVALTCMKNCITHPDDQARFKAIVDAFSELEERYPDLKETATRRDLSETELRLQKEIENTRLEIKQVEGILKVEIKQIETNLVKTIHQQTLWVIGAVGTIIGSIRLLDWFLIRAVH